MKPAEDEPPPGPAEPPAAAPADLPLAAATAPGDPGEFPDPTEPVAAAAPAEPAAAADDPLFALFGAPDDDRAANAKDDEEPLPPALDLAGMAVGGAVAASLVAGPAAAAVSGPALPAAPRRRTPPAPGRSLFLLTWASIATLAALWLWWTRPPAPTGLEDLVDDGQLHSGISPVAPVPAAQVIPLGTVRRVGWLEIAPQRIEFDKLRVTARGKTQWEPKALVLRVRMKNLGPKPLHPTDPAYQTLVSRGVGKKGRQITDAKTRQVLFENGYTYSFLHPADDPATIRTRLLPLDLQLDGGERLEGQEFPKLAPGEAREVFVASQENPLPRVAGPMLWRLKVRKALSASGTGAATVIGVPFAKADVKMLAEENARLAE